MAVAASVPYVLNNEMFNLLDAPIKDTHTHTHTQTRTHTHTHTNSSNAGSEFERSLVVRRIVQVPDTAQSFWPRQMLTCTFRLSLAFGRLKSFPVGLRTF